MLDVAINFLISELNTFLFSHTDSDFGNMLLSKVVDDSGKWAVLENHLGASLINIEEDRVFKEQLPATSLVNGQQVVLEPEIKINLHVLFSANFQSYEQAIKYISLVLLFFQSRPSFMRDAYPSLDPRISRLTAELQTLNYEQLNQIWAFIGGKQLPSVVYKVRVVAIQDTDRIAVAQPVTRISSELHRA